MNLNKIKTTKSERNDLIYILSDWKRATRNLKRWNEDRILKAMVVESQNRKRLSMLRRLKGRFNILRNAREDRELVKLCNKIK